LPPCPQPLATCAPSDDGLILCAPNGNIVAWNAQAERIFGSSTAEAVGRPVTRFFATQSRDEVQQVIGCASPDADAEWLVAEGVHESGAHMALSIAVSPLYAANGMMVGALVAVRKPSSAHSAAAETTPLVDSAQRTYHD